MPKFVSFGFILSVVFVKCLCVYGQLLTRSLSSNNLKDLTNPSLLCRFPITGEFYIEDKGRHRVLKISEAHFETKGDCVKADKRRDFFVVKQNSNADSCFRCILFLAFHDNVIRFKESPCVREEIDLEGLCRRIAADSKLFTIFRTNAKAIPCPIPLPATFSYYVSSSEQTCRNDGRSIIDECSVPNRFRLSFVSCPQASRSITHDEAFECIADWNHYSTYYFAARVVGNPFDPALGDYRCFIVDHQTSRIGMSADASCLELTALDQAALILEYSNAEKLKPNCTFPGHVRSFNSWISVTTGNTAKIMHGRWEETAASGEMTSKAMCLQEEGNYRVVRKTMGCNVGIYCLKIDKTANEVFRVASVPMAVEDIELCKSLQNNEEAKFSFDMFVKDEYVEQCPMEGLLFSDKCSKPLLTIGCDFPSRMNLTDICSIKYPGDPKEVAVTESLACRSSYRIKNETFVITSSRRRFLCMKFWLKNHDRLVVDTFSDTSCHPEALQALKRLPERFEIVQTAGCPSRANSLVRFLLKTTSSSSNACPKQFTLNLFLLLIMRILFR